LALLIF